MPWSDWQLSTLKKSFGSSIKKKVNLIEEILNKNQIDVVTTDSLEKKLIKKYFYGQKNLMEVQMI